MFLHLQVIVPYSFAPNTSVLTYFKPMTYYFLIGCRLARWAGRSTLSIRGYSSVPMNSSIRSQNSVSQKRKPLLNGEPR